MDEFLSNFPDLIQYLYKEKQKSGSLLTRNNRARFPEVISYFEQFCPTLAKRFSHIPSVLYPMKIIEFALEGLGDPLLSILWQHTNDVSTDDSTDVSISSEYPISTVRKYSRSTVRKYSRSFGIRITTHLIEKNLELEGIDITPKANPLTLNQYLRQTFGLSDGEIKVLLAYSESENKGRKVIADELVLSPNTIKTHTRSIMKKMKTKTINDAVQIVKAFKP